MRHPLVWIAAVLLLCGLESAQALMPVPSATGYLTDRTGTVEPAEMARIQVMLGKYEVASGRRVSVLLVENSGDEDLEAFADRVLAAWGMDQPERGGALLLWSAEGYVLIRAAGPLSERLHGEAQSQILSRWVVPAFARGEAGLGIRQGVEQMIAVLDGGSVAEPPSDPVARDGEGSQADEAIQEHAVRDALERGIGDPTEEPEGQSADRSNEAALLDGLPAWIGRLPEDLRRLTAPFSHDLDAGVLGWLREAGGEADQLPVQMSGLLLQMRGERVEPAFPGLSEFAVYAWAVSLGTVLLALLPRRAIVPGLMVAVVDTGIFLWLATGFVALSGLLVLVGMLTPLWVPLLRAILRGSGDPDSDPAQSTRPIPQSARSAQPPASVRPTASLARTARIDRAPARPATARTPSAPFPSASNRQQIDLLLDRLGRIAVNQARRLRPMHAVLALVLCIISLPLAFLVALGVVAVVGYRSGAAYLLADTLIRDRGARQQLLTQLPRPPADVLPDA